MFVVSNQALWLW